MQIRILLGAQIWLELVRRVLGCGPNGTGAEPVSQPIKEGVGHGRTKRTG